MVGVFAVVSVLSESVLIFQVYIWMGNTGESFQIHQSFLPPLYINTFP